MPNGSWTPSQQSETEITAVEIKLDRKFTRCAEVLINVCNAQENKTRSGTTD